MSELIVTIAIVVPAAVCIVAWGLVAIAAVLDRALRQNRSPAGETASWSTPDPERAPRPAVTSRRDAARPAVTAVPTGEGSQAH